MFVLIFLKSIDRVSKMTYDFNYVDIYIQAIKNFCTIIASVKIETKLK